jgi:hypothetical protein
MIWVRKTGMTLNSTMTLYGISTIDDALRFIFSFARAILIFFKTHDLYAFCVERPTTNDFFLWTPLRGARFFYNFVFVSTFRRRTALHLDVLSTLRYTVFLDILFSLTKAWTKRPF